MTYSTPSLPTSNAVPSPAVEIFWQTGVILFTFLLVVALVV